MFEVLETLRIHQQRACTNDVTLPHTPGEQLKVPLSHNALSTLSWRSVLCYVNAQSVCGCREEFTGHDARLDWATEVDTHHWPGSPCLVWPLVHGSNGSPRRGSWGAQWQLCEPSQNPGFSTCSLTSPQCCLASGPAGRAEALGYHALFCIQRSRTVKQDIFNCLKRTRLGSCPVT